MNNRRSLRVAKTARLSKSLLPRLRPRQRSALISAAAIVPVAALVAGVAFLASGNPDTEAAVMADKASQIHMKITNSTNETLRLGKYDHAGTSVHWQQRPTDLTPGQTETIDVYAAGDPSVYVDYTGADTGTSWSLTGSVPSVGGNTWGSSSSNPDFSATVVGASGYTPTFTYDLHWGRTFHYTGTTQTITVPAGVTKVRFSADGGPGGDPFVPDQLQNNYYTAPRPLGTRWGGAIGVTPGEQLTVAVGGRGNNDYMEDPKYTGGWSLDGYRGGAGGYFDNHVGGGGGATLILNGDQKPLVIAAGGGGSYGNDDDPGWYPGITNTYGWGGMGDRTGGPGNTDSDGTGGDSGRTRQINRVSHGNGEDADASSGGGGGGGWVGGGHGPRKDTGGGGGLSHVDDSVDVGPVTQPFARTGDRTEQTGQVTIEMFR